MPDKPSKPAKPGKKKTPQRTAKIADKAKETKPKVTSQRIEQTGLTSRVKGHVKAQGKRKQGKKDGKA